MKVVVLTTEPFPIGMAATNRMISYSKGLVELSHEVDVICLRPTEPEYEPVRNEDVKGEFEGIKFTYVSGTTIWPKSRLKKLWSVLKGVYNSTILIRMAKKQNDVAALIMVTNIPLYLVCHFLLSRLLNIRYIQEKSEYPFVLNKRSFVGKIYAYIYVRSIYKLFDGMIIMTEPLQEYFKMLTKRSAKHIVVPMTVEPERFVNNKDGIKELAPYIAYCGYMGGNKDGVDILIDAFILAAKEIKEVKLYLIGDTSNKEEYISLQNRVKESEMADRIVFTGRVSRDEIPAYLCNASALALARPTSLQSQGGFPTKLGEYLSTGNPVIVTRVGTIPDYLTDEVNAYVAQPDSIESFAKKIMYVFLNIEMAKEVGLEGQKVALNEFSYKMQSKRIADFIESLATN